MCFREVHLLHQDIVKYMSNILCEWLEIFWIWTAKNHKKADILEDKIFFQLKIIKELKPSY